MIVYTDRIFLQTSLINSVSIALLKSPKLENQEDNTRRAMLLDLDAMAKLDPEFLLKVNENILLNYGSGYKRNKVFVKSPDLLHFSFSPLH